MARVRLASWYDGHAPGEVVEVADDMVGPLRRDGRVAEVLPAADPPTTLPAAASPAPEPAAEESPGPRRGSRKGG